jgi:hypothetical protein
MCQSSGREGASRSAVRKRWDVFVEDCDYVDRIWRRNQMDVVSVADVELRTPKGTSNMPINYMVIVTFENLPPRRPVGDGENGAKIRGHLVLWLPHNRQKGADLPSLVKGIPREDIPITIVDILDQLRPRLVSSSGFFTDVRRRDSRSARFIQNLQHYVLIR